MVGPAAVFALDAAVLVEAARVRAAGALAAGALEAGAAVELVVLLAAVAAVFLIVVIGMVTWIGNQGKGRASTLLDYQGNPDDDGAAGAVRLSCAVAEQALKSALQERTDLVGVTVASYDFRKQTAIKIRVLPRQGVSPHVVASDITDLVAALDKLLGFEVPILLSIGSGARSRFTKAERVR